MAQLPMAPPLDGVPPSPPGLGAGPSMNPPSMSQLNGPMEMGGGMQLTVLALETASTIAEQINMLGQIFPSFMPVAASLQQQLKDGLKVALEQGLGGPEPAPIQGGASGMGLMSMMGGMEG